MSNIEQGLIGKGYIQVYTGNGKGKTTAALGLAFRAMGSGLKTYIGQFMKGQKSSELDAALAVSGYVTIEQYGKMGFTRDREHPDAEGMGNAKAGLVKAKEAMLSGNYDIVVLDEINTAHFFHLVTIEEMLDFVKTKPEGVELVFTGRYAPEALVNAADLVTEMVEVKHYYRKGMVSRKGIED
jgi:cob(I)alamin adenosyltransferase